MGLKLRTHIDTSAVSETFQLHVTDDDGQRVERRDADGELVQVNINIVPLTPQKEQAATERAKVRVKEGGTYLTDATRLQMEMAVECIDAWADVYAEDGSIAPVTRQAVELLAYEDAQVVVDVVARAKELYRERHSGVADAEGNS